MAELPPRPEGIALAHFIVSDDVERSRRFYTEVLGGRVIFSGPGGLTYVALANTWIIINVGGGPTDDKPTVSLETPRDLDRVSAFLNIRVKDIATVYADWSARGAQFLTPPKQHQYEIRCYIRDPDGHLIEVGQTTDPDGDWTPPQWLSSTAGGEPEGMEGSGRRWSGRSPRLRPSSAPPRIQSESYWIGVVGTLRDPSVAHRARMCETRLADNICGNRPLVIRAENGYGRSGEHAG